MAKMSPENKAERAQVKAWMIGNYAEHVDPLTGELNTTKLAEDAAERFDLYEGPDFDIDQEWYFVAYEAEQILVKRGLVQAV